MVSTGQRDSAGTAAQPIVIVQADGGTHVANTSGVGAIRVTGYASKGRINKRIRISLMR